MTTDQTRDALVAARDNAEIQKQKEDECRTSDKTLADVWAEMNEFRQAKISDLVPRRRSHVPVGECAYCDKERAAGSNHFPAHDASSHCESGRRPHCTCDICW